VASSRHHEVCSLADGPAVGSERTKNARLIFDCGFHCLQVTIKVLQKTFIMFTIEIVLVIYSFIDDLYIFPLIFTHNNIYYQGTLVMI